MPYAAVWDYYCLKQNVPVGPAWIGEVKQYEQEVLSKRQIAATRAQRDQGPMNSMNPFLGVFFHWLGGLASGSFYVPYRFVRRWSWETYWLVGGVFSWIIAPWVIGSLLTNDLLAVLREAPASCLFWTYFWARCGDWAA